MQVMATRNQIKEFFQNNGGLEVSENGMVIVEEINMNPGGGGNNVTKVSLKKLRKMLVDGAR